MKKRKTMNYSTTVVCLPREVLGEIEVVTRSIEPNSNDDEGKDDEESSDGDEPPPKQKKQNKKTEDRKIKAKVEKQSSEKSGCY